MVKIFFSALALLIVSNSLYAEVDDRASVEIDYLISFVSESECLFNRNGTDYRGNEAIEHIRKKYDYFKEEIKSTEDFIRYAATRSEFSGKKYTVSCAGETTDNLDTWLLERLLEFRQ